MELRTQVNVRPAGCKDIFIKPQLLRRKIRSSALEIISLVDYHEGERGHRRTNQGICPRRKTWLGVAWKYCERREHGNKKDDH